MALKHEPYRPGACEACTMIACSVSCRQIYVCDVCDAAADVDVPARSPYGLRHWYIKHLCRRCFEEGRHLKEG